MKTTLATCVAGMTCSAAILLGAQAPSSSQKPDESFTKVTGCVQPGATVEKFVLASTAVVPDAKPNVPDPKQADAEVPVGVTTNVVRYELVDGGSFDLGRLVGHRVEASGRVSLPKDPGPPSSITDSRPDEHEALIPLRASTVRDVAPAC